MLLGWCSKATLLSPAFEEAPRQVDPLCVGICETAQRLGVWRKTVSCWRQRWLTRGPGAAMGERLADAPRPGAPATLHPRTDLFDHRLGLRAAGTKWTADQPVEPERSGTRGGKARSGRTHLAALAGAFFKKESDLQPHRFRLWFTRKPDPHFEAKCAEICAVYRAAAEADADGLDR